jgi:hypothetical protein
LGFGHWGLGFDWDLGTWDLVTPGKPCQNHQRHRRAFVAIDALIALGIVAGLAIMLAAAVRQHRTAAIGLADARSAVHLAEHAMLNLQHHQKIPVIGRDSRLQILPVTGGDVPPGYQWAEVRATVAGHERSLIGIIPDGGAK